MVGSLFLIPLFQNSALTTKIVQTDNKVMEKKLETAATDPLTLAPNPTVLAVRATATPTPLLTRAPQQTSKIYLGLALEPINTNEIAATKTKIKGDFSILMGYKLWGHPIYPDIEPTYLNTFKQNGKTPLITWEPWVPGNGVSQPAYQLKKITAGGFDGYILKSAQYIKDFGSPIFLRFAHEMNGNWYPWGGDVNGNSTEDYIAAYRHVHDIFTELGVKNVTWVWSPNEPFENPKVEHAQNLDAFYPGDEYVDWVVFSSFNWGTSEKHTKWRSFSEVVEPSYKILEKYDKPLMISEINSSNKGGDKNTWLKNMAFEILKYPKVKAIVWFETESDDYFTLDTNPTTYMPF